MSKYYDIRLLKAAKRKSEDRKEKEDWITQCGSSSLSRTVLEATFGAVSSVYYSIKALFRRP